MGWMRLFSAWSEKYVGVLEMLTQEMFSLRQVWKSEFKLEISCKKAFHPRGNARDKKKHQGYGGTGKVSSLGGV